MLMKDTYELRSKFPGQLVGTVDRALALESEGPEFKLN